MKEKPTILIYGAGGHGQVVTEAAAGSGWNVLAFVDDHKPSGTKVAGLMVVDMRVAAASTESDLRADFIHIAVGDNDLRKEITSRTLRRWKSATVIHPTAWVSPSARLGQGVFVGPGAIIHTGTEVGDGAIINSGAIIEHHCRIGPFVHIAPRAVLGGAAVVDPLALIGLGASILPVVRIGQRAIIGAGAAVIEDVPPNGTVVGVPAKQVE